MEDKIQEIMGLVDDVLGCDSAGYQFECKRQIQSKLCELVELCSVREPLSDEVITMIDDSTHFHESTDWPIRFARNIERAHGITNTTKE